MSRMRRPWKAVVALVVAAIIPLALMGCRGSAEHPSSGEHPSKEQGPSEHPSGEHPK